MSTERNLYPHETSVSPDERARLLGQRGCVVWFTGLSGSGKSTLAHALEAELVGRGHLAFVLDGDTVRQGLNANLGFSPEDRTENIRRVSELAALFADAQLVTLTAFISPYSLDRERAREIVGDERFFEIHVHAPLEVCEERDPKGLYRRARAGEIQEFTGVSAPYEAPPDPELRVDTSVQDPEACVEALLALLDEEGFLTAE
ncbi:MAG: adenylyl-sulfate kinase [Thermoanaerobaculia bacterium]|nr:adenylyl-sulfate kinase [Thermoanaerobaculia bacterium]